MDEITRNKLVESGKTIYRNYLVLDRFREHSFTCDGQSRSLQAILADHLPELNRTGNISLTINGKVYLISIHKQDNQFATLSFTPMGKEKDDIKTNLFKKPLEVTDDEVFDLISNTNIALKLDEQHNLTNSTPYVFIQRDAEPGIYFGGPDKIELYTSHLNVIYKIISHLEKFPAGSERLNNILIALTTGSGKTFIQAMWFNILYHARVNAVFALPDNLTDQFKKDFKRLLPNDLVDIIKPIKEQNGQNEQYLIGSHEDILINHLQAVMALENAAISVDEQHEATDIEAQKVALIELAKKHITTHLTATPDKATLERCVEPVAVMSGKEKKEAGQGAFSRVAIVKAKTINDMRRAGNSGNWLAAKAADYIDAPVYSATTALLADLPYQIHLKDDNNHSKNDARHNIVPVMGRKAIVCPGDNVDDVLNIFRFAHAEESSSAKLLANLYSEGNVHNREAAYQGLLNRKSNLDENFANKYIQDQQHEMQQVLIANGVQKDLPWSSLAESLDCTIFHGLVDLMIRGTLSYNKDSDAALKLFKGANHQIKLNEARQTDLTKLSEKFTTACATLRESIPNFYHLSGKEAVKQYFFDLLHISDKNPDGIDQAGAKQTAELLQMLLYKAMEHEPLHTMIVDNWSLDTAFKKLIEVNRNGILTGKLSEFYQNNRTMFVMSGLERAETNIQDGKPFRGFERNLVSLQDKNGNPNEKAKKRFHTAPELLGAVENEVQYTPAYCDPSITEAIADNYYRLGIVGMYVSNRKSKGFNDPNHHNVISIIGTNGDLNNKPSQSLQLMGRNRGLDKTQLPIFTQIVGHKATPVFDVTLPAKTEKYYKEYFVGEDSYKKHLIQKLGADAAHSATQWLIASAGKEADGSINTELFKFKIFKTMLKKLRSLNNRNDHQIKQSRSEFGAVLSAAQCTMEEKIEKMKHPFKLPLHIRFIGNIIYGLTRLTRIFDFFPYIRLRWRSFINKISLWNRLRKKENVSIDDRVAVAYGKVMIAHSLQQVFQKNIIAYQMGRAIKTRMNVMAAKISKNPFLIIDQTKTDFLNTIIKEKLLPVLAKYLPMHERQVILDAALNVKASGWENVLFQCKDILLAIGRAEGTEQEQLIKTLATGMFSAIPGLSRHVEDIKMLNFNQAAERAQAQIQSLFAQLEEHTYLKKELSSYLQKPFLAHLRTFMPLHVYMTMYDVLSNKNNADAFSDAVIKSVLNNGDTHVDFDQVHNLFVNYFIAGYPDLQYMGSANQVEQRASEQAASVPHDIQAIFARHISIPEEQTGKSTWWTKFSGAVAKTKAAAQFTINHKKISADLQQYFTNDFLKKASSFLPFDEYNLLSVLINSNPAPLAEYIITHISELENMNEFSAQKLIPILMQSYPNHPSVKNSSIFAFRSKEQITSAADTANHQINADVSKIIDDYKNNHIYLMLADLLKSDNFSNQLSELIILRDKNGFIHDNASNILFEHLNSGKIAYTLAKLIIDLKLNGNVINDLSQHSRISDEKALADILLTRLQGTLSSAYPDMNYEIIPVDNMLDKAQHFINHFQQHAALHIDYTRYQEQVFAHIAPFIFSNENKDLLSYALQDLNLADIAAILEKKAPAQPAGGANANFEQQAAQLIRFAALVKKGDKSRIMQEFFNIQAPPAVGNLSADAIEDHLTHAMEQSRVMLAMNNMATLFEYITDSQTYYHRTTMKGDLRHDSYAADIKLEKIADIYKIRPSAAHPMISKFNLLQAQSKAAAAADRISAMVDKDLIDVFTHTKKNVFSTFNTFIASSFLWRGLVSMARAIKQWFVRDKIDNYPRTIARHVRHAKPLTYSTIQTALVNGNPVPVDAIEPALQVVQADKEAHLVIARQGHAFFANQSVNLTDIDSQPQKTPRNHSR